MLPFINLHEVANATQIPAALPLTENELLQRAIFKSDGIVIGSVIRTIDSTKSQGSRYALIRPLRWLKGSTGSEPIVVYFSLQSDVQYDMLHSGESQPENAYVIFLLRAPFGWYLNHDLNIAGAGVVTKSPAQVEPAAERIAQLIGSQTLDSMSVQSDLIALGTPLPPSQIPATLPRPTGHYAVFRVDSVLAGDMRDSVIAITSPVLNDLFRHHSLLFLTRSGAGGYEAIASGAGVLELRADTLRRIGLTLSQATARVRTLRAARFGGDHKP